MRFKTLGLWFKAGVLAGVLGGGMSLAGEAAAEEAPFVTVHGDYTLMGALHRTGGSGDRSLLTRGEFMTNELGLNIGSGLETDSEWKTQTDLRLRHTNDPVIDTRDSVHLLGWTTEIYNPELTLTMGDFYGDFTQYTLSQALKGAQVKLKRESVEIKGVAGYSRRQNDTGSLRYVAGGGGKAQVITAWGPLANVKIGSHFTAVEDDNATLTQEFPVAIADMSNRVGGFSFEGEFMQNTQFDGEMARTWIDADTSDGSNVDRQMGTAVRANSFTRIDSKTRMRANYEWVSADFNSLAGSAVPDRVTLSDRIDYRISSEWSAEGAYRVSYDKLDKSALNKKTVTHAPHAGLTWMPDSADWLIKDYYARAYWDLRQRMSEDDPSGQTDFTGSDYGIDTEGRIEKVFVSAGWLTHVDDDDLFKEVKLTSNGGYVGARCRHQIGTVTLSPSIRFQFDYVDLPKIDDRDFNRTLSLGLRTDMTERLSVEGRCAVNVADRSPQDSDSARLNTYLGLEYRLPTPQDLALRSTYEHLTYNHSQSVQSFSEHNWQTSLVWTF